MAWPRPGSATIVLTAPPQDTSSYGVSELPSSGCLRSGPSRNTDCSGELYPRTGGSLTQQECFHDLTSFPPGTLRRSFTHAGLFHDVVPVRYRHRHYGDPGAALPGPVRDTSHRQHHSQGG